MRIILATPIYPPEIGGPATYTKELATRLSKSEQITIVTYADEAQVIEGTKLVLVAKSQGLITRLVQFFFALLREARKADVIYVQNAVAAGLPAALAGLLLKKPVVLKFVGDEAWERATQVGKTKKNLAEFLAAPEGGLKTSIFISIQRFVLNHVTAVVPPSEFLAEILEAYYGVPPGRVSVNYNAFEGAEASAESIVRKPHQVLSVGRLVLWKRIDGIMGAFKILRNAYPDATLVIAGEGPEEQKLKSLAQELGIAEAVEFKGRVSREQVGLLEGESGVIVLNSTYEGLPHIALEAFASRTPLVATDIPGTKEAVMHEKTGLLVPAGDEATLAVVIERIFAEPELRLRLVTGGLEALSGKFSWEQHLQSLLAIMASFKDN
jgi:glycosyltransferase involved in cell wall biosynthesis